MFASIVVLLSVLSGQFGQSSVGELRLTVTDPDNLPLECTVSLISESNQVTARFETDPQGSLVAKRLFFGRYRLEVSHAGFSTYTALVDIQSALPLERHLVLSVAPVQAQVSVTADDTLIDRRQSGTVNRLGAETIQRRLATLPGRSVAGIVNTQPGWLLEANGVLHPRGSEYQVQFVIDGLPVTDNHSPSFAPEMDADEVRAINVFTGGYPAEYGRKLGGVLEIVTAGVAQQGLHGDFDASGGSFGTAAGSANTQYTRGHTTVAVSGSGARTDRYLDPPVEENFTNHGNAANLAVRLEHDVSDADRLGVIVRHGQTRFLVPNERVQEDAGQRQERTAAETSAQGSYQRVFGGAAVGDLRVMTRTLGAGLASNAAATPIVAEQDRRLRETYAKATVSIRAGSHEWKAGVDADFGMLHESFGYHIADRRQFDSDTPRNFSFSDQRSDREQALFVQDRIALGAWTVNAGVRWDHYQLVLDQNAFSPRVGVAWASPKADLVVRASYDRAFQTPAIENLLLASSPLVDSLNDEVAHLPVAPSIGDFSEVGISKRLFQKVRLDATHFDREMTNFADDDVLLNTGVSFPIAFRRAHVRGTEVKIELPRWKTITASVSYTNMVGVGTMPITGGLFLGDGAASALRSADQFPISQDQRNTVRGRVSYQFSETAWVSSVVSYGSGLPVEFDGSQADAVGQYGQPIVDRVDFNRGRVRPSMSFDLSGSLIAFKTKRQQLRIQADLLNLTNRLNVINFAGLFSGTSIAPPRSFAIRLHADF